MAARLTLSAAQGAARDFRLQTPNPADGTTWGDLNPGPFLATDPLAAAVWAGLDQPPILSPAATWVDAPSALYQVSLADADTAALAPGTYRLRVTATRGGRSAVIADCRLEITPSPGTAAAVPVYTTYEDMLLYARWLDEVFGDGDEAGFLRERGRARKWLEDVLCSRYKPATTCPQIGEPGFMAAALYGTSDYTPSKWLRDRLAANLGPGGSTTLLTANGGVVEICARRAIAYACDAQIGPGKDATYIDLARRFYSRSDAMVKGLRAELDLDGDGWADLVINCGGTNVR